MYFPAFYATRELVMNEKSDLTKAMMLYKDNMSEDLAALWKVRETLHVHVLFALHLTARVLLL